MLKLPNMTTTSKICLASFIKIAKYHDHDHDTYAADDGEHW